jgi:D-glycero-D-manno-heptose 1,7-bisphosphate phosphatase
MTQLVILDRDGVINQDSDAFIKSVDEFILLPNTVAGIIALKRMGATVAMATNQSGIARGLYSRQTLHAMHAHLQEILAHEQVQIDWMVYSPYVHETPCRKPSAGLYQVIAWRFGLTSLVDVPVIGDSWRDLEAALSVGAKPILVKTGKGERTLAAHAEQLAQYQIPVVDDLLAAAQYLGAKT